MESYRISYAKLAQIERTSVAESPQKMSCELNINLWWDGQPDFFQKLAATILCLPIEEVITLKVKSRDRNFDLKGLTKEGEIHHGLIDRVGPDHLIVSDEFQPHEAFIIYHRNSGVYEIPDSI